MEEIEARILGVLYGNACGDAIGLLTEFMSKETAKSFYGDKENLEYSDKILDGHRQRWKMGDWTDDTDQMILIMLSLVESEGRVCPVDYGGRLKNWARNGFNELGDAGGMGLGSTTKHVLLHTNFETNPHAASLDIWEKSGRFVAPNGALMRTSVLGTFKYNSLEDVKENTLQICKVTHADPRCQAATVAMTTAIALMLQRQNDVVKDNGTYNVDVIIKRAYDTGKKCLNGRSKRKELKRYMMETKISNLKLGEKDKIGYIYKCLGAGFWALKQEDFRKALQEIVMEAGDADTNGAVAGALLGCKLGFQAIPETWLNSLLHKAWFDDIITRYMTLVQTTL